MPDNKKLNKELISKYPNLSGNKIYVLSKNKGIGIRKTEFYKLVREVRSLPEPSKEKREKSIPIVYRKVKPVEPVKPTKIPYEQTKFGKIAKSVRKKHKISEKRAIERARALLKIPKTDYDKLNQFDRDILEQYGY